MGFIENAAEAALGLTLDRVRRGEDAGQFDPRPGMDLAQQADFLEEQAGGRTDEPFRQALLYHGFVWWPVQELRKLPGAIGKLEGEWRHEKLRLAFTVQSLAESFPQGPESFDGYIRDQKMAARVTAGKLPKDALRAARLRK